MHIKNVLLSLMQCTHFFRLFFAAIFLCCSAFFRLVTYYYSTFLYTFRYIRVCDILLVIPFYFLKLYTIFHSDRLLIFLPSSFGCACLTFLFLFSCHFYYSIRFFPLYLLFQLWLDFMFLFIYFFICVIFLCCAVPIHI